MSGEIRAFPGVSDISRPVEAQVQDDVVLFIERLLERAQRGDIQGIAVATVHPGHGTADGWTLGARSTCTMHDLMASTTYLQVRMADRANQTDKAGFPENGGG